MGIKVRSLGGFETQGIRGSGCCGQRGVRGLGDPIMMLEGVGAITDFRPKSGAVQTSPGTPTPEPTPLPPKTSNCPPGEVRDEIEQQCVPIRIPPELFSNLVMTATFVPFQDTTQDPPPGGALLPTITAPSGGGSGASVPRPEPAPAPTPAPSSDGGIKVAIAAGGIMVAAALLLRGGR